MISLTDQSGYSFFLPNVPPKRIVSLVPSQTELLAYLGLEDEVVGITKFCVHPEYWFQNKLRIGGTKNPNLERIASLQADLILGNKEENRKEDIEWLRATHPVWISDINDLPDALEMIHQIGLMVGKEKKAQQLSQAIALGFESLPDHVYPPLRVAYFIWNRPKMVAGSDTFIHEMLLAGGWLNAFAHLPRYPEVSDDIIREIDPDLIFLSSEPYPFKEKHVTEYQTLCPNARVAIVDGELFSWYGSRLLKVPAYIQALQKQLSGQ